MFEANVQSGGIIHQIFSQCVLREIFSVCVFASEEIQFEVYGYKYLTLKKFAVLLVLCYVSRSPSLRSL